MGKIARVESLDEAFSAVQRRTSFIYHQSPSLRFLYQPLDDRRARLVVAQANKYPERYEQTLAEMSIFIIAPPVKQFVLNGWHCAQFQLERQALI